MSIKIIALDMDGTVLKNNKTVSERTYQALEKAAEHGIYVIPATGRSCEGLPKEIGKLPFIRYVIGTNGAVVYDILEEKVLYRAEIGQEESLRILDYMAELPAILTCYQNGKGWCDTNGKGKMEDFAPCPEQIPFMRQIFQPIENMRENIFQYGPTTQKLQVFFLDEKTRDHYLKEMVEEFPEYSISYSLPNNIEVNAPDANKGSALKFLCEYLNIDSTESMAFGDGINDITMIRYAGVGVAMGNAEAEVLEVADRVAPTNEEDGVAVVIEELFQEIE